MIPNRDKEREKITKMVNKEKSAIGKKSRREGKAFEVRVRKDLISKGWIVVRFDNNVEIRGSKNCKITDWKANEGMRCVQAKAKFNPFTRSVMNMSSGFPDFMAYQTKSFLNEIVVEHEVIFVECKTNGKLDKTEKEKAKWYLDNNYCSKFLIASKKQVGKKIEVEYKEYEN